MSRAELDKREKKPPIQTSVMTSLGLIKGEILEYLEKRGLATQEQILNESEWPSILVTMAIGHLIGEGLVRAKKFNGSLVIFEASPSPPISKRTEPPGKNRPEFKMVAHL